MKTFITFGLIGILAASPLVAISHADSPSTQPSEYDINKITDVKELRLIAIRYKEIAKIERQRADVEKDRAEYLEKTIEILTKALKTIANEGLPATQPATRPTGN